MSQFSVRVRDVPVGTQKELNNEPQEFTENMRELVGRRIMVTESAWRDWFVPFPPYGDWFHRDWLTDWVEI